MSFFRANVNLDQAGLRPAQIQDLNTISQLLSRGRYHHSHPGCEELPTLLQHAPALALAGQRDIWATIIATRPERCICWIAHLALAHGVLVEQALARLLPAFHEQAQQLGVGAIYYNSSPNADTWLSSRLQKSGYQHETDVVTYAKYMLDTPGTGNMQVQIRRPELCDLSIIMSIDEACFEAHWAKDSYSIQTAFKEMPFFVIAELHNQIIGYAYAASYFNGKQLHLIRIAVLPSFQGYGIGLRLLTELTDYARSIGTHTITLNTQEYNTKAQRLYSWFGFRRTNERHMILHRSI